MVPLDVDGGNTNTHTLMSLTNGETYTISIVGTSSSSATVVPSTPETAGEIALGILQVSLKKNLILLFSLSSISCSTTIVTATFIRITGSVSSGSVVTRFVVEWLRVTVGCSDVNERTISENGDFTIYTTRALKCKTLGGIHMQSTAAMHMHIH